MATSAQLQELETTFASQERDIDAEQRFEEQQLADLRQESATTMMLSSDARARRQDITTRQAQLSSASQDISANRATLKAEEDRVRPLEEARQGLLKRIEEEEAKKRKARQ